MADVRRTKEGKVVPTKKVTKKKAAGPRILHTLTPDELNEYQNRHRLLLSKQMEFYAASNYVDILQNALIEEYGLPIKFNLDIETGVITEVEVEDNDQNGRV
jgi:hypothetical protein